MKTKLIYPIGISLVLLLSWIIYKSSLFQNQDENTKCINYDYLKAKEPEGEKNFKIINLCKNLPYISLYLYISIPKNNYSKLILELINENNNVNISFYSEEKLMSFSDTNYLELNLDTISPGNYFLKIIEEKKKNSSSEIKNISSNLLIKYKYSTSEIKTNSKIKNDEIQNDNNLKNLFFSPKEIDKGKTKKDNALSYSDILETVERNISVTRKRKSTEEFKSNSREIYKFIATIKPDEKHEGENNYKYYKFVKVMINSTRLNDTRQYKSIYASTHKSFYDNDDHFEERGEFKAEGKSDNLILTIPYNRLINDTLYIKFHYKYSCNFTFTCIVEDGRRIEGISINHESCYDIFLDKVERNSSLDKPYRFLFSIDKKLYPLITFTSDSSKNFTLYMSGSDNKYYRDIFINGYAFIPEYSHDVFYEYHTFLVEPNENMNLHICHRVVDNYKASKISVGEKVYSSIRDLENTELVDSFEIENDGTNYSKYIMNYITKSKDLKLTIRLKNGTKYHIFKENSGTLFLDKDTLYLKFSQGEKDWSESFSFNFYSSIYFQLLGEKDEEITQNLNAPLIKGFAMEQILTSGKILFYRIEQFNDDINYNFLFFQSFSGKIGLYESSCEDFKKCSFKSSDLNIMDDMDYSYENSIYQKYEVKPPKDIYQKYNSSVFIVYCKEGGENDTCEYLIGITDEKTALVLSPNRKIYSYIENENENYLNFAFIFNLIITKDDEYYEINKERNSYFHFELHSLVGNLSNITTTGYISDEKKGNGPFYLSNNDNKSYHFIDKPFKSKYVGFIYFNFSISGRNNTLFYVRYNVINEKTFFEINQKINYKLSDKEMHYNKVIPKIEIFSYSLPDKNNSYIISISGINSYIYNSIDDNKNNEAKYTQINNYPKNSTIDIYCLNEAQGENNLCEYIISPGKLENHTLKKNIEFDGFYQYYIFNDGFECINLYYYFSDDEIKNKRILVNINKNSSDELIIGYGFNYINEYKTIYKHNEIFIIELNDTLKPNNNIILDDILNGTNFFIIQLKTDKDSNMELRIKTNIKNKPTYLDQEKIELGYLENNESLYYYFDYFYNDLKEFEVQEVYINNKGNVKSKIVMLEGINNTFTYYDENSIDYDNIVYIGEDSGNNHFKIFYTNNSNNTNITETLFGLRFYLKIYLNESEKENSNIKTNNLFTIYRHTQNEKYGLSVELNSNMYGHFYTNNEENYYFYTDISNLKGGLIISLNCIKCILCIKDRNNNLVRNITSNVIIKKEELNEENILYYSISGEKGYYYFSISDSDNNPIRNIEQLEEEMCNKSCNFIFPLHNYYNYSNSLNDNGTNLTQIILFVSDNEKAKISYKYSKMSEFENDDLKILGWEELKMDNNKSNNKLFIDLNQSDIRDQEKYLMIHAETEEDKSFNLIMNKFIFSENTEDIKPLKNIVSLNKNEENRNDILSLEDETLYKISLHLINGNGSVSLDSSGKYEYNLNFETQKSISIYVKLSKYSISAKNFYKENDFKFYIKAEKINEDEIEEILKEQKNYKVVYFRDESNENNDIFPLKIRVSRENQKNKYLFVNYRFIELEPKDERKENLYETTGEKFELKLDIDKNNSENIITIDNIYYPDFRRGYLSLEIKKEYDSDYIKFNINKNFSNISNSILYNKLFLEITPLFIGKLTNDEPSNEKIYIPKSTYVQFDLIDPVDLIFSEISEYNNIEIDLANIADISINNINDYNILYKGGKRTFTKKVEGEEYTMKLGPSQDSIFLKYSTKKNEDFNFSLLDPNFNSTQIKEGEETNNNSFEISHYNISIPPKFTDYMDNINITYFIRVFNYLDFLDNKEIDNILIKKNALLSYRKEVSKVEKEEQILNYKVNFGQLEKKKYYINIIGAAELNHSVEYFAFKSNVFEIKDNEEESVKIWVILVAVVGGLILIAAIFIIIIMIKKRKPKKKENVQIISSSDIVVNLTEMIE